MNSIPKQHAEFLPLFKPVGEDQTLGPFIADQRLFHLEAPFDKIRQCLSPQRFQFARQLTDPSHDSRIQHDMPTGCQWQEVETSVDRENLLIAPSQKKVCILFEAGTGKTIAMQQIQYLRTQKYPNELTIDP